MFATKTLLTVLRVRNSLIAFRVTTGARLNRRRRRRNRRYLSRGIYSNESFSI
jgi:hypothetical protein